MNELTRCPYCQTQNPSNNKFCVTCGKPIDPESLAQRIERRKRFKKKLPLIGGGIAAIIVVAVIASAINGYLGRPEAIMKNYMTAMANGNYGKAYDSIETENLGNKGDSKKLFAALMETNKIKLSKDFTIEERSSKDTRAVFDVTYTLNGDERTDQVTLEKGKAWRIRENTAPMVEYMTSIGGVVVIVPKKTTELRINGVKINNNMMKTAAELKKIKSSGVPTADPIYGRYITDEWDIYWFDGLYAGRYTFETKSPRGNSTRTVRLEGQRNGLAVFATQEDYDNEHNR